MCEGGRQNTRQPYGASSFISWLIFYMSSPAKSTISTRTGSTAINIIMLEPGVLVSSPRIFGCWSNQVIGRGVKPRTRVGRLDHARGQPGSRTVHHGWRLRRWTFRRPPIRRTSGLRHDQRLGGQVGESAVTGKVCKSFAVRDNVRHWPAPRSDHPCEAPQECARHEPSRIAWRNDLRRSRPHVPPGWVW